MEVLAYITVVLGILLVILQFYIVFRSAKVYQFRVELIHLCSDFDKIAGNKPWINGSTWEKLRKKIPSHNQMTFSFKPIKMESWLTEDDIKKLK